MSWKNPMSNLCRAKCLCRSLAWALAAVFVLPGAAMARGNPPHPEAGSAVESAAGACAYQLSFTRLGGRSDDFALPPDPAFRSQALEDVFPAVTWKDFDSTTPDRNVQSGHRPVGALRPAFRSIPVGRGVERRLPVAQHGNMVNGAQIGVSCIIGSRSTRK